MWRPGTTPLPLAHPHPKIPLMSPTALLLHPPLPSSLPFPLFIPMSLSHHFFFFSLSPSSLLLLHHSGIVRPPLPRHIIISVSSPFITNDNNAITFNNVTIEVVSPPLHHQYCQYLTPSLHGHWLLTSLMLLYILLITIHHYHYSQYHRYLIPSRTFYHHHHSHSPTTTSWFIPNITTASPSSLVLPWQLTSHHAPQTRRHELTWIYGILRHILLP